MRAERNHYGSGCTVPLKRYCSAQSQLHKNRLSTMFHSHVYASKWPAPLEVVAVISTSDRATGLS